MKVKKVIGRSLLVLLCIVVVIAIIGISIIVRIRKI